MNTHRLREKIAFVAARLLHEHQETEYVRAKRRAARKLGVRFHPADLPSNRQIRDQLRKITETFEQALPEGEPRALRIAALAVMRKLAAYDPLLIGAVANGSTEPGSPIDIKVKAENVDSIREKLTVPERDIELFESQFSDSYAILVVKRPLHIRLHLCEDHPVATPEALTTEQLIQQLEDEKPEGNLEDELDGLDPLVDRFEVYRDLLAMLEDVKQDPDSHPEGDALYHSLQVFDLAVQTRGYDEEFCTAALLHDVGKAITLQNSCEESSNLLEGIITHRTDWLIAHLDQAHQYQSGELGIPERHALQESEDFDDLMLLCELDLQGRKSGVETSSLDEAIDYLRQLDAGEY